MRTVSTLIGILLPLSAACGQVDVNINGHILKPDGVEATAARQNQLRLPDGFRLNTFAEGLGKPRMLAVANDGTVYVTRREPGDCVMLRDTNGDGKADQQKVVATLPDLHGIALHGDRVFLVTIKDVYVAARNSDGSFGEPKPILRNLPDGGQHPNRTIAVGPDSMLYITVGSTCNACGESNKESATMLRAPLDGQRREVFASGLRNTIGFDWHPETNELWGMDHGIDWLGDNEQGEELNLLVEGARYGWPYVYGKSKFNPSDEPPGGTTHEQWAKQSREPELLYTAHAAPMQMTFYRGSRFPAEYRNDAFIAFHGSWNRKPPSGYEIVRVRFEDGKPTRFEPFLQSFLIEGSDWKQFGRPAGLAEAADGSLLFSDDENGVIYRISYGGSERVTE